jgi:hypothetical protein
MMPLLFALSKSTKCNTNEAAKLIQEGINEKERLLKEASEYKCRGDSSPKRSKSKSPEPSTLPGNDYSPLDLSKTKNDSIGSLRECNFESKVDTTEYKKSSFVFKPYLENFGVTVASKKLDSINLLKNSNDSAKSKTKKKS